MIEILQSEYFIDGVRMQVSPFQMLENACGREVAACEPFPGQIVDEIIDPSPIEYAYNDNDIYRYAQLVASFSGKRQVPPAYSACFTSRAMACILIDSLWKKGRFKLGNLAVEAVWKWSPAEVGNMAALYQSIEAACNYLDGLGVGMKSWKCEESSACRLGLRILPAIPLRSTDDDISVECPFTVANPEFSEKRMCPVRMGTNPDSWIIYVPFDTCSHRLGGSLLSHLVGDEGGKSPDIADTDYFMDCYEVLRELVEDGVVTAGVTVGEGGLMRALGKMTEGRQGIEIDMGPLMRSYSENNMTRLLFGEVPGVIIEIADADYDYVDAEFLLQDVAYYPLGHPCSGCGGLRITVSEYSGISGILQSLLSGNASEGED